MEAQRFKYFVRYMEFWFRKKENICFQFFLLINQIAWYIFIGILHIVLKVVYTLYIVPTGLGSLGISQKIIYLNCRVGEEQRNPPNADYWWVSFLFTHPTTIHIADSLFIGNSLSRLSFYILCP